MIVNRNQKYWIYGLVIGGISLFMVFIGGHLIEEQIIKNNQINNCEILIRSFGGQGYTEEELLKTETFEFSYYWGLQNDYWECDKWFDKNKVIQEMIK